MINKKKNRFSFSKYCSIFDPIGRKLSLVFRLLRKILHKERDMSQQLDALTAKVAEIQTSIALAITAINSLKEQVSQAIDPESLNVLSAQLDSAKAALDAAVAPSVTPETPQ